MPLHQSSQNDTPAPNLTPESNPYECPQCGADEPTWELQANAQVDIPFLITIGNDGDEYYVDAAYEAEMSEPGPTDVYDIMCCECGSNLNWQTHAELVNRLIEFRENEL